MGTDGYDQGFTKEDMVAEYHRGLMKKAVLLIGCIVGIVLVTGLLSVNVYPGVSLTEAYGIIWGHITGTEYELRSQYWWADRYIWNYAIVYAVTAILAGAGLACCGTLMQSLMANPLADPYSTGISSGAALGAMMAMVVGVSVGTLTGTAATIVNAFIGAMVPAAIVIILSERIRMTPATLILIGTALSMFFSAFMSLIMLSTDPDTVQTVYTWQLGTFSNVTWDNVPYMAAITIVGSVIVMCLTKKLNVMSLGDNSAQSLGINVRRFRTLCLTLMAVMTAGIVAFVGIIGFVGLVCPHIVRLLIGSDNRFVVPISMALGALLLLISDYIAMILGDITVGVVMSALGAPIFFLMIVLSKNSGKGAIY